MKKQGVSFYITLISVILAVAGLVVYNLDAQLAYYAEFANQTIIYLTIGAIVAGVVAILFAQFKASEKGVLKVIVDIARVALSVLLVTALMLYLNDRVYHFAIVLGSDLEKGNTAAFDAVYHSIAGIVVYAVGFVAALFASFGKIVKRK